MPGAIVAEEKIGAHPDFRDVQPFDEHGPHERLGLPERHLTCEAHDRNALHAGAPKRIDLLVLRHQQRRRLVGPTHTRRMRIERHRRRRPAPLARPATDAVDDLHVPAMQPVEVAERQYRLRPAWRGVVGVMGTLHGHFAMGASLWAQWAMGNGRWAMRGSVVNHSGPPRAHHRPAPFPRAAGRRWRRDRGHDTCA